MIDQVASCVRALVEHDAKLAELVLSRETLVNAYDGRLDRDTLTFIALQPVASDLRMVRAIARAGLELERIGDEVEEDARFASRAARARGHDPVVAVSRYLRHMGELSVTMLRSAVRALDEVWAGARGAGARSRARRRVRAPRCDSLMSFVMQDHQFLGRHSIPCLRSRAWSGWAITPRTWRSRCSTWWATTPNRAAAETSVLVHLIDPAQQFVDAGARAGLRVDARRSPRGECIAAVRRGQRAGHDDGARGDATVDDLVARGHRCGCSVR